MSNTLSETVNLLLTLLQVAGGNTADEDDF